MEKIRDRIIAYILVFCTLVSAICTGITMPVAAAEDTGSIELNTSTVQIWDGQKWVDLTEGTTVRDGDLLNITFNWSLDNIDKETKSFSSKITPLENVTIPDMPEPLSLMYGNTPIGTYQVVNGELIIIITDDEYLKTHSERKGGVTVTGQIAVNGGPEKDGEKVPVVIVDQTINAYYQSSEPESSLGMYKYAEGTVVKGADGKYRQTFRVSLTAYNGDITINKLMDSLGDGLSNMSDWTVISYPTGNEELSQALAGGIFSLEELNNVLQGKTLSSGENLTFEYTVEVSEDIYKADGGGKSYSNAFSADYTTNGKNSKTGEASASASANRPTVEKKGVIKGDDELVEWTITIDLKDWKDKSFDEIIEKISDELGSGFVEENISISKDDFHETSDGSGIWVATYTTHISEDVRNSPSTTWLKNKVTVTVDGNEYTAEDSVASKETKWIEKAATGYDPEKNLITWEVTLQVPDIEVTNVSVRDFTSLGQHTLQTTAVWVDGELVVENGQKVASNEIITDYDTWYGINIVFNDDYIQKHAGESIKIIYTTLVEDDVNEGNVYRNQAQLTYFDVTIDSNVQQNTEAEWKKDVEEEEEEEEEEENVLSKEGELVEDEYAIKYTLEINIDDISGLAAGGEIKITDVLPEGLELDENSIEIADYKHYPWGPEHKYHFEDYSYSNYNSEKPSVSHDGKEGTITFTIPVTEYTIINGKIAHDDNNGVHFIHITYVAKVTDSEAFAKEGKEKEFTNKATATYNENEIGSAETTTKLTPKQIVTKTADYSEDTAPYIYYTIDVNPDALDLSDGWLLAKDTLGSALTYDLSTIKVSEYTEEGTWKDLIKGTDYMYTYDASDNSVTFQLPDQKHLQITYTVLINLSYSTDETKNGQLTPENSFNRFQLTAFQSATTQDENDFDQALFQPKGWAEATLGRVTINKYYTDDDGQMKDLDGAVFRLSAVVNNDTTSNPMQLNLVEASIEVKDGKTIISGLSLDQIYVLEEITAPAGYGRGEPFYFVLPGSSNVTLPEGLNGITCASEGTIYYENFPKTTADGQLVITKTVTGAEPEEAEAALKFMVTGPNGESTFYTLEDFEYDVATKIWTLTLTDLELGEYTVEELLYGIENKVTQRVSYTVSSDPNSKVTLVENGAPLNSANPVTLTEENNSITVAYEDEYVDFGSLTIQKTVTGLDWDKALTGKGTWRFEVYDSEEKLVRDSSISSADFDGEGNTRSYTFTGLKPGTYTVKETVTSPEGYTCITTYSLNVEEEGVLSNATDEVTVDPGVTTTVYFTNEYIQNPGTLTIKKIVNGDPAFNALINNGDIKFVVLVKKEDDRFDTYAELPGEALNVQWDEANQTWTLNNLPPGEYKVVEIASVEVTSGNQEYVLTGVSYIVEEDGETTQKTGSFTIEETPKQTTSFTVKEDGDVTVEFTNTYEANVGSLVLQKTVSGIMDGGNPAGSEAAWETVRDTLTFEVYKWNGTDYKLEYTIYGDEAKSPGWTFDEGAGVAIYDKLQNIDAGRYKVVEISGGVSGYALTTEYVVDFDDSSKTTDGAVIEIIKDSSTTVTIENTYKPADAELVLEKKVEGILDEDGKPLDPKTEEKAKKAWDAVRGGLTFVIEGNGAEKTEVSGGDDGWNYDPNSGSFKKTVSLSPGTYTVTEQISNIPGYVWKSVSYTVTVSGQDASSASIENSSDTEKTTLTASDIVLGPQGSATVCYTNEYEGRGTLILNKTVTGLSKEKLEEIIEAGKITFTIVDADTEEKYNRIFTVKEHFIEGTEEDGAYNFTLTFDGGEGKGHEEMLPAGVYRIEEAYFTVDHYSEKVTFEVTQPDGKQGPSNDSGNVYEAGFTIKAGKETEVNFHNDYEVKQGTLILQKTVSGILSGEDTLAGRDAWEAVRGSLTFYVYAAENGGYDKEHPVKTISGGDPEGWRFEDGVAVFKLNLDPGTYIVVESADIDGYDLETVYKIEVGGNSEPTEEEIEIEIESEEEITVSVTNTYSQNTGSLTIKKTITGDLKWDEIKAGLSFEIYVAGEEITGNPVETILGLDPLWKLSADGKSATYKISGLEPGQYTVIELVEEGEIVGENGKKYVLSEVTYKVGEDLGDCTANRAVTLPPVDKGGNITVEFSNTYAENVGTLVLQKSVTIDQGSDGYAEPKAAWDTVKDSLEFKIYAYNAQTSKYDDLIETIDGNRLNWNTEDRVATIELSVEPGKYMVVETRTDLTGYTWKQTTYVVKPSEKEVPAEGEGATFELNREDTITVAVTNEYSQQRGKLILTKTVKDLIAPATAEGIVEFTITDGKDYRETFTLGSNGFSKNGSDNEYKLELELPIGEYTITETHYEITGYITEEVSYIVNGNGPGKTVWVKNGTENVENQKVTVKVEDEKDTTVAYTDSYVLPEPDQGMLTLKKTISGVFGWNDVVAGNLRFEVYEVTEGGEEKVGTYTVTNIPDSTDQAWEHTIYLNPGIYIVKEVWDGKAGISCTATYEVTENGSSRQLDATADSAKVTITENGESEVAVENHYVQEKGQLEITKIVKGVPDELAKENIVFTVTNMTTGEEKKYPLKEFSYNESEQKYTQTLEANVGHIYTVEETYYIDGFLTQTVKYKIESGADIYLVQDGNTASTNAPTVVVNAQGQTVTVAYTDVYAKVPSLVLKKSVVGLTWDKVRDSIRFTVTGSGYEKTFTGKDFDDDDGDGIYTCTIPNLEPGKYTITETVTDIEGNYTCTTKYTVDTGSDGNENTAKDVPLTAGKDSTVVFTNTYTQLEVSETSPSPSPEDSPSPSPNPSPSTDPTPTNTSTPSTPKPQAPSNSVTPPAPTPTPQPTPILQVPSTPSPSAAPEDGGNVLGADRDRMPQTGDYFFMWLSLFLASLSSLIGYLSFLNKKNRKS